jgi:hypothetical protein
VTVNSMGLPTDPCDTKTVGCVKFEILDPVTKDHNGDYHYRIRFTNNCAGRTLTYVALQVPDGTLSPGPLSGNYTAPSGRTYWVRNPNHNPFYSVRFKANNPDALGAGQSEIFEYIIDQQGQGMTTGGPNGEPGPGIENMFIHAFARMSNGVGYEVHLNTFDCHLGNLDLVAPERPSEAISAEPVDDGGEEFVYFPANVSNELAVYPNPTRGELFIDLSEFKGQDVQLYVLNARGQRVQAELMKATDQAQALQLVNGLSDGLYYLEIEGAPGAKQVLRFVLQR